MDDAIDISLYWLVQQQNINMLTIKCNYLKGQNKDFSTVTDDKNSDKLLVLEP